MEKFIREMRQIARRSDETNPYQFFKAGHAVTARVFIRQLKKQRLTPRKMKAARRFLEIVGYNEKGKARQDPAQVFDHALSMHRDGTTEVLDTLEAIAKKLSDATVKQKIKSSAARNPSANIAGEVINARAFLNKQDMRGLHEDIDTSKVSQRVKQRLRRYLEDK